MDELMTHTRRTHQYCLSVYVSFDIHMFVEQAAVL
jgi:hypothetical protein